MSKENNFITVIIGSLRTGRTAKAEERVREAEARGKKVHVFKRPTSDTSPYMTPTPSDYRTMTPELFKALQTEELNKIGSLKWWEIGAWLKTFKKR